MPRMRPVLEPPSLTTTVSCVIGHGVTSWWCRSVGLGVHAESGGLARRRRAGADEPSWPPASPLAAAGRCRRGLANPLHRHINCPARAPCPEAADASAARFVADLQPCAATRAGPDGLGLARAPDGAVTGPRLREHVFRRVQAPAARHRSGRDRRLDAVPRPGRRAGRRDPRPVPRLQAPQARPPAPDRAAAADPDALHQHDQPGAGADLPGRRGDGAAHPPDHPLERGRHGPARQLAVLRASAATSRPTPARPACTRPGSTTSSGARTARAAATRSSTRATPPRASTPGRSSRAA